MNKPLLWLMLLTFSNLTFASAIDEVADGNMAHAVKEIGAMAALMIAISMISGLGMVSGAVSQWMKSADGGGMDPDKTIGRYIASAIIGVTLIILPITIVILFNTLYGGTTESTELSSFAINDQLANLQTNSAKQGLTKYLPASTIFAFYGILFLIGLMSLYKGLRTAWVAITFGNDMYGTSMPFKTWTVIWHIIFGMGLMFLNYTQCLIMTTLGQSRLCW